MGLGKGRGKMSARA